LSIKNIDLEKTINLYPNPCSNSFKISYTLNQNGPLRVEIFSLSGQLVQSEKSMKPLGKNEDIINTASLPNGTYLVHVTTNDEIQVFKVSVLK
jgi:Secretion system C-terminal sorting domain